MSTRADEPTFNVNLTLRLSIPISFVRGLGLPDDAEIRPSDAIDNAIGSIPDGILAQLEGAGFEIAMPIDGEAEEIA